ncbi:MAG: aminotransferase class III-fold pyridoxal phosphate-dependent enzyme, partial [Acidobacteriota bacterium]|nr:aminotransferase class III-fold pyridoxal phosphate-dependent enzyme [Acidobacteriota bacterium]
PNVPGHLCAEFGSIETVAALADETAVAAVMLEPIQSMAGVRVAAPEFYRQLRELCDERGMLLIFDEVQTGVGRTGEWFFAGSEAGAGVVPDVITLAKALGSGVPVGACLTTDRVAASIKENDLGTTFGGGMLAMAAVSATLEAIEQDGMLANAQAIEKYLRGRLANVPQVAAVRGRGLLLGIEFQDERAAQVNKALLERRIITGTSSDARVLRLLPPLCLQREEVDLFVDALVSSF